MMSLYSAYVHSGKKIGIWITLASLPILISSPFASGSSTRGKNLKQSSSRRGVAHDRTDKICVLGDAGHAGNAQSRVGAAMAEFGCSKILYLGDNFYPRGVTSETDRLWETRFRRPYASLLEKGAVFFPVLGNHDYASNDSRHDYTLAQIRYSQQIDPEHWHMPAKYYSVRVTDWLCAFGVDTNQGLREQSPWLSEELRRAPCAWKVVQGHHPIVSSGEHGPTGGDVERYLRPALQGADLYLAGHEHSFQDEGMIPTSPQSGSSRAVFRQIVAGTGGAPRYGVRQNPSPDLRFAESSNGFLSLAGNERQLRATYYAVSVDSASSISPQARYSVCLQKTQGGAFEEVRCNTE